jgi:hypothetical protein
MKRNNEPMDLRKYTSQTTFRLIIGAGLLLFIVGLGLIAWIYSPAAALMGFLCLLGMLIPIGLIIFFLFGLDKIVKKMNDD